MSKPPGFVAGFSHLGASRSNSDTSAGVSALHSQLESQRLVRLGRTTFNAFSMPQIFDSSRSHPSSATAYR